MLGRALLCAAAAMGLAGCQAQSRNAPLAETVIEVQSVENAVISEPAVLKRWRGLDASCRGGFAQDSGVLSACAARDKLAAEVKLVGWCDHEAATTGDIDLWFPCERPPAATTQGN
jgi:hypothetical protein